MQDYYAYKTIFQIFMFILGTAFGSFLCCQARRLHLKETEAKRRSKKSNITKSSHTRKQFIHATTKSLGTRSVCLNCGRKIMWYDNIPIFSWIFLKGKCRSCGTKIGCAEVLSEIGLGLAFFLISINFNLESITPITLLAFIFTLLLILGMGFLAIYDGLYGELPSFCLIFSLICAVIVAVLYQMENFAVVSFSFNLFLDGIVPVMLSILVLAGTYLTLYLISDGKWVGDGDWLIALVMAIVLGRPWLALIALFLTNLLACIVMLPYLRKKSSRPKSLKSVKIYLGPYLVSAFVIVLSFSDYFISLIKF